MPKLTRNVASTDVPRYRPLIARDLVKLYKAFTERFPDPRRRPEDVTVEAFHALFDTCQTEYLHFIGRTSASQPYARFLVEELLSLACIYMILPTLLPQQQAGQSAATLVPHVQPFGFLLVYLLYATQPLHTPPTTLPASTSSPASAGATGGQTEQTPPTARAAAQQRRKQTGIADLTVLEFALREIPQEEIDAAEDSDDASPASASSPRQSSAHKLRSNGEGEGQSDGPKDAVARWEMEALDDKDLFPRLYPLPITIARPVMAYYLNALAPDSKTTPATAASAVLLPVERFILAALQHHRAWHLVPVVDFADHLAAVTAAHTALDAPLMKLSTARGAAASVVGSGGASGRGRGRGRLSVQQLLAASRLPDQASQATVALEGAALTPSGAAPSTHSTGSLFLDPHFQSQLSAYRTLVKETQT